MKIIAKLDIIGGNWMYTAIYMNLTVSGSVSGLMAVSNLLTFSEEKLAMEYDIVAKINASVGTAEAQVGDVVWI